MTNRFLIDSRWVYKKEKKPIQGTRSSMGEHPNIGVDFVNNYSPFISDITLHVILIICLIKIGTPSHIFETEFLYRTLE